jgi:Cof subfamily protein (haloacid dehalogenase superfamily)
MYELIFIDIDGTLLTSDHKISEGTLSAIKRVSQINQIPVILTTARPPQAVEDIYSQLNLNSPVVYFNGALILHKGQGSKNSFSVLQSYTIDTAFLSIINITALPYNINISCYKKEEWFSGNYDRWVKQEEQITGIKATILNMDMQIQKWANQNEGPHKILLMGESGQIDKIETVLKKITFNQLNIYKSKPTYLEIMSGRASKTSAITFLINKFGLTNKDVLAIGDNYNDIEMLRFAGMGVAMGNAPDQVKAHAQFITLNNDADGVKFALDTFIK